MFYAFSDAVQTTQLRSSSVLFQVVKAEILNLMRYSVLDFINSVPFSCTLCCSSVHLR